MAVVGCYTLDLYCDGCGRNTQTGRMAPDQYTGETFAECAKQAKRDGWRVGGKPQKGHLAHCPDCVRRAKNA